MSRYNKRLFGYGEDDDILEDDDIEAGDEDLDEDVDSDDTDVEEDDDMVTAEISGDIENEADDAMDSLDGDEDSYDGGFNEPLTTEGGTEDYDVEVINLGQEAADDLSNLAEEMAEEHGDEVGAMVNEPFVSSPDSDGNIAVESKDWDDVPVEGTYDLENIHYDDDDFGVADSSDDLDGDYDDYDDSDVDSNDDDYSDDDMDDVADDDDLDYSKLNEEDL